MHVPNPAHWDQADTSPDAINTEHSTIKAEAAQNGHPHQFSSAIDVLEQIDDATGPAHLEEAAVKSQNARYLHGSHDKRRRCPQGKLFYRCANGFTGCCSIDPCDPGATCPDVPKGRVKTKTATTTVLISRTSSIVSDATSTSGAPEVTQAPTTTEHHETIAQHAPTSILSASQTSSTLTGTTSTTEVAVPSPPPCPQGNGSVYMDDSKIKYNIRCGVDNTYTTYSAVRVGTGGYAECFSACSYAKSCVGFTYGGSATGSGTCYLKGKMPIDRYQKKGNHVSCDKTNPNALAPSITESPNPGGQSKGAKIGIIVGAVFGGILLIILILLIIAWVAKRHRKKVERKRATITHIIQGPIETQQLNPGGHQRQGSSGHDVFAPFGGFYQDWSKASPRESTVQDVPLVARRWSGTPPGVRAESGLPILPATTYQPLQKAFLVDHSTLDGSAMTRPGSQSSGSRLPRFHEHIAEAEANDLPAEDASPYLSPNDSPTLGQNYHPNPSSPLANKVRRQQHLTQQKEENRQSGYSTPPYPRTPSPVSPVSDIEPVDRGYSVSPLFSSRQKQHF